MSPEKPRNFAFLTLPGGFECRCDGVTLEARVGDGPWLSTFVPPQYVADEAEHDRSNGHG